MKLFRFHAAKGTDYSVKLFISFHNILFAILRVKRINDASKEKEIELAVTLMQLFPQGGKPAVINEQSYR